MAEFEPRNLGNGQLSGTKATLYTVPVGRTAIIRSILLVNTNVSAARIVNVYVNFGSGSRRILPRNLILSMGTKFDDNSAITLEAGDIIEGQADNPAEVDYIISGVEGDA